MVDQEGKYNMNNTLILENAFNVNGIKEECQDDVFADDKVHVSKTAIIKGNPELQDHLICDKMGQYDISITLNNVKTELLSHEVQYDTIHNNFKIEEGISPQDIKIEFNNGLLYCEHSNAYCEDYCTDCGMLVHILNKNVLINPDNKSQGELLPNDILEICIYFGQYRILALKVIPVGVRFGPFTGLNGTECAWKIKGGKFVVDKNKSKYLNWMQYINAAKNISEQNLLVFRYADHLYYQSTRQIQVGDELLVYFGERYEDSLNRNVEMDLIPTTEHIFKDAFACAPCCLGFSSKSYLVKHKTICPRNSAGRLSIEELVQCPFCKIHFVSKEYIHLMAYCCEKSYRKSILPSPGNRTAPVNDRKTRKRRIYMCQQCKYRTKYKGDLKTHTNQHFEVKMYKCGVCCKRFKMKEVLRLHVENIHICAAIKEESGQLTGDYVKSYIKTQHSCSQSETKQFKCSLCRVRTNYKRNLKRHIETKHSKEFSYKCDKCDYKSNQKHDLKRHVESRHSKEFKYKCGTCDYKANRNSYLKTHVEAKHWKLFKYKCEMCDYKTSQKSYLKTHIEAKHLKEFKYKCDTCDYISNRNSELKRHVETRHAKEFKYKCDTCDYKSNQKYDLKRHIESRHEKEFKYKCGTCDYKANRKSYLKTHIEAKHLKLFKYKCGMCNYKANQKSHLNTHLETRHLKAFKYKCDTCD